MSPDELANVISSDVVIGSDKSDEPKTLNMDAYAQLLAEERECTAMAAWWKQRGDKVKKRIREIMGDHTVGTVNGIPAVYYEPQNRFDSTTFRGKYPDMFRAYSRPITEEEFDVEWFKRVHPEIYSQFQVRPLRVTYDAPGT